MGICCEKKTLIGWRNVWNMRWRASDQEVDQRGHGQRLCKKNRQSRNLNREDAVNRGRWKKLIKIGWWSGWWVGVFLLVPAHPVSPGQRAVKRLLRCYTNMSLVKTFKFSWSWRATDVGQRWTINRATCCPTSVKHSEICEQLGLEED